MMQAEAKTWMDEVFTDNFRGMASKEMPGQEYEAFLRLLSGFSVAEATAAVTRWKSGEKARMTPTVAELRECCRAVRGQQDQKRAIDKVVSVDERVWNKTFMRLLSVSMRSGRMRWLVALECMLHAKALALPLDQWVDEVAKAGTAVGYSEEKILSSGQHAVKMAASVTDHGAIMIDELRKAVEGA